MVLAAVFRRRAFRSFAEQAAEVVAVGEAAGVGDVFHFHIVALQQHTGLFETNVVQIFIEAHWPTFLEQMRKIVLW